jgi:PAS domain S-box-containing protein
MGSNPEDRKSTTDSHRTSSADSASVPPGNSEDEPARSVMSGGASHTVFELAQTEERLKLAEEALRESEERYRELFENLRDAIYIHDLSGRYISVNRAAEELSGYRREEIIGRHYSNFVAPSHLKYARESLVKKLDETVETNYEAEIISKSGRRTPVEISSRLIYENGIAVGIQGTARDISERKQTQEALRIYSRALIEAQETERQNIGRELRDEIGEFLTAIKTRLEAIKGSCQTDACRPYIDDSLVIVDKALERVRALSLDLRPSMPDNPGLPFETHE